MLIHLLNLDALVVVLQCLDPCDLAALDAADGGVLFRERGLSLTEEARFEYHARRVLTNVELAWFADRRVRVKLLQEHKLRTNGMQEWFQNGQLHRAGDLPAIVWADGRQDWYHNGQRHRAGDRPAIVWADGRHDWYQNGQCHRVGDRPAIVWASGTQEWYQEGELHRDGDLPAVVWADGCQEWHQDGELHRGDDLPAIVWADGRQEWFQNGERHRDGDMPAVVQADGMQEWWQDGELHRAGDMPAVVQADGTQEWYQNGQCHRDGDQPAVMRVDGSQLWYQTGQLHRGGDQPAVMYAGGRKEWYQNGERHRDGDQPAIAQVGPNGGITHIHAWTVLDLCPPTAPDQNCTKCATGAKPRTVKAAFAHPTRTDEYYCCVVHARQEKFGFFPQPLVAAAAKKRKAAAALLQDAQTFADDGVADDAAAAASCDVVPVVPPAPPLPETSSVSSPLELAISKRLAVTKSVLLALPLPELLRFAQRHPGFSDMTPPLPPKSTKAQAVAALAAHMSPRIWRPCRRGTGIGGSGGSESGAKVSVVEAGMRFAGIAQASGLFHGVDELIIENQLGFVAARMKSMQDVISCLAIYAGVQKVRAVSAATKLNNLVNDADYAYLEEENDDAGGADEEKDGGVGVGGGVGEGGIASAASERTRKIGALTRANYKSHKSQGIAQCRAWMSANPTLSRDWIDVFERTKKKDDMADAILQLLGQL